MRRSWAFSTTLAAATSAFVLAQAGAAAADEPTRQVVTLHRDIPGFIACSYGPLNASFDLTRDITIFTDNGTPVREIIHGYGAGSITNPATGQSLDAFVNRVFVIDLANGGSGFTVAYNTRVPLPGGGTAIIGGGQLVFDSGGSLVAAHGPDTASEIGEVCGALAP